EKVHTSCPLPRLDWTPSRNSQASLRWRKPAVERLSRIATGTGRTRKPFRNRRGRSLDMLDFCRLACFDCYVRMTGSLVCCLVLIARKKRACSSTVYDQQALLVDATEG
ncbi:hypothetical protein BU25DRAFT_481528, partial [Macroventuria anomochaeta]